jgi:hypothetical protein
MPRSNGSPSATYRDDENGVVHHIQHLSLYLNDGKGPQLLNDGVINQQYL